MNGTTEAWWQSPITARHLTKKFLVSAYVLQLDRQYLNLKRKADTEYIVARVMRLVTEYMGVTELQIKGNSRKEEIKWARFLCMYMIKRNSVLSYQRIGYMFGERHHTTVMSAFNRVNNLIDTEENTRLQVYKLESLI